MRHYIILAFLTLATLTFAKIIHVNRISVIDKNHLDVEYQIDPPPPHTAYAQMARYLVHNSNWTSMGTISSLSTLQGFPMVNVIAMADSAKGEKSTGNIYYYLTMLDFTAQDLSKVNKLTTLFSMDQTLYCSKQNIDPMEPTCARVMISGNMEKIPKETEEYEFAYKAMVSRHPSSTTWIHTHDFFLCRLNISQICVLDYYGGPHYVPVDGYFRVKLYSDIKKEEFAGSIQKGLNEKTNYEVILN